MPDPAKDETGELGKHRNNICDDIVNDLKNIIKGITYLFLETNHSVVI